MVVVVEIDFNWRIYQQMEFLDHNKILLIEYDEIQMHQFQMMVVEQLNVQREFIIEIKDLVHVKIFHLS